MKWRLWMGLPLMAVLVRAEMAPQPQVALAPGPEGTWNFDWMSEVGNRTFFAQGSVDLVNWAILPVLEYGAGPKGVGIYTENAPKYFFRLKYTDREDIFSEYQARVADFDGDGFPNWIEVEQMGSDPLDANSYGIDADGDGLADRWELFHFGSLEASDGTGSDDGDWLTDLEEFLLGLDPNFNDDVDMDGWIDGDESRWLVPDGLNVTKIPSQILPWGDEDGDGLANALESDLGTGPFSPGLPEDTALAPAIRLTAEDYDDSSSHGVWENTGRLGGEFVSVVAKPLATVRSSKAAVEFQGGQADWMLGPRVPSWLNGAGSRTVAAWVFNPAGGGSDDDVVVSWGDPLGSPQRRLFSCRYGPAAGGALKSGVSGTDRGWGDYSPVTGEWSFVIYRYESKSGALVAMRDFEAGFLDRNAYLETGIFAGGGRPHAFVLGGDNDGAGGRTASSDTSLCIGDLWVWDRSVPLSEIIAEAYEPFRISYGKVSELADGDTDGLPDVLEESLEWNPELANSDRDGEATGGGDDGFEFEQGTDPLDFHNGRPHQVAVVSGNHQTIYGGQPTAAITFKVIDMEGEPIPHASLNVSVAPSGTASGEVREAPGSYPDPAGPVEAVTDEEGEVSIIFKAD